MYNNVLDVFYKYIVNEASEGIVNCYFKYNMRFNTHIVEDDKYIAKRDMVDDLLTPTLMIKNKEVFNKLMLEYVELALKFYDNKCFPSDIVDNDYRYSMDGISKEKIIMTLLWSNATNEDFNDPCQFLRKRIAFFELDSFKKYTDACIVGYSDILNSNIEVEIVKNALENETPYSLKISLRECVNNKKVYEFPRIYFGILDNVGYVYAIQNSKSRFNELDDIKQVSEVLYNSRRKIMRSDDMVLLDEYRKFIKMYDEYRKVMKKINLDSLDDMLKTIKNNELDMYNDIYKNIRLYNEVVHSIKKIDRMLYQVNEGLDVNDDNYLNYEVGNLKDITPNSLVAANILMGLFNTNNITKIEIPSFLVSRWNAKMMMFERQRMILFGKTMEDIEEDYNKYMEIQSNLTEKFLRVFRRIGYHHSSIMVSSYPYETGSNLELKILNDLDVCNNKLLTETYNLEYLKNKSISK